MGAAELSARITPQESAERIGWVGTPLNGSIGRRDTPPVGTGRTLEGDDLGVTVRNRRIVATVATLVVVAALAAYLGVHAFDNKLSLDLAGRACTVQGVDRTSAGGAARRVSLGRDQMANAATIAAVGIRRHAPEQAIVVALAAAYQESGLSNRDGGDRDSVGLFQQRPSQGWGTPEQLRDPRYAANRFYSALMSIKGWQRMRVTDAAQAVQRSAYPQAYQKWADESQVLAEALLGLSTGAVACLLTRPALWGAAAEAALNAGLALDWGNVQTVLPAERPGLAIPADDTQAGWRYAHWLVSHADQHGVQKVQFGGLQWTAQTGSWRPTADSHPGGRLGRLVVAEVFTADK